MMKTLKKFPKILPEESTTFESIGSIDDLLIQILVHVPLKPLFRFKLVCKHWNSIISDPRFELMRCQQVHNNNNRAVGLFFQNPYKYSGRNSDLLPPMTETSVVPFNVDRSSSNIPNYSPTLTRISHSCNGLLVLRNANHVFPRLPEYYVYNPTTNQITTNLLIKAQRPRDSRVRGMYLAFDPSKSPHYKVVCVWKLNNHKPQYQFEVYSSESRSWKKRSGFFDSRGHVNFDIGVYWNGAIHWLGYYAKSDSIYFNPDLDEMPPRVMPTPPFLHPSSSKYFAESCGHLHCAGLIVGGIKHLARRGIYVYEMRRDYSEWFLKFRVDEDVDTSFYVPNTQHLFCVLRGNKDDEDSFLVWGTDEGEIIRYDLVRKTCQTIAYGVRFNGQYPNSFQYIESPCFV